MQGPEVCAPLSLQTVVAPVEDSARLSQWKVGTKTLYATSAKDITGRSFIISVDRPEEHLV